MANNTSARAAARKRKHIEALQRELSRFTEKKSEGEQKRQRLEDELDDIAAPDEVDAKGEFRSSVVTLFFSSLLAAGFVFFAELSLEAIGFPWDPLKLYLAAFVFWLGTVVTMHIYMTGIGDREFSNFPWALRVLPFLLIIIGVLVLALARGLLVFLPTQEIDVVGSVLGETTGRLEFLQRIAKVAGFISQPLLSLGLDLGSGVVAFVGMRRYLVTQPIWQRYKIINYISNHTGSWGERIAAIEAELQSSGTQSQSGAQSQSSTQSPSSGQSQGNQPSHSGAQSQSAGQP